MADPAQQALVAAAFAKGYADQAAADSYYRAHPGSGFPVPADKPAPLGISPVPRGAGYSVPPEPRPVFVSSDGPVDGPSLLPAPDVTVPPPAVTGFTTVYPAGHEPVARQARHELVFAGAGEPAPRRSLLARLLKRGR